MKRDIKRYNAIFWGLVILLFSITGCGNDGYQYHSLERAYGDGDGKINERIGRRFPKR